MQRRATPKNTTCRLKMLTLHFFGTTYAVENSSIEFPNTLYKIFYRIEPDRVIVFRVLHAKQDHRNRLT